MKKYIVFLLLLFVSACGPSPASNPATVPVENTPITATNVSPTRFPAPTSQPTPTETAAQPPKQLTVCIQEPAVPLNPYTDVSQNNVVLQALNDGPIDYVNFTYHPVILEYLPSPATGDVVIQNVTVQEGDIIYNPFRGKITTYVGNPTMMEQMVVKFQLRSNILWADGTPLTAHDSVYAYVLLKAQPIDTSKDWFSPTEEMILKTHSYRALDDYTIEWVGIPGLVSANFPSFVFDPMPNHLDVDLQTELLVGWGAFTLQSWKPGEMIEVARNSNYTLNTPAKLDKIVFRFIEPPYQGLIEKIVSIGCQIVSLSLGATTPVTDWETLAADTDYQMVSAPRTNGLQLVFNLAKTESPIQNLEIRKTLTQCLDREGIAAIAHGIAADSFVHPSDVTYRSIEALSFTEMGENTATETGLLMAVRDTSLARTIAQKMIADLAACGFEVEADYLDAETFFKPWPEGPVFSGAYDLVIFPLGVINGNSCQWYLSDNIPSEIESDGLNVGRYQNTAFDEQCRSALLAITETERLNFLENAQEIWGSDLPALPLFWYTNNTVVDCHVSGYGIDPTGTELWNIEKIELLEECNSP